MRRKRLVIVLSGFPRRSETFALGELLALERRGLVAAIFSTKPGEAGPQQPDLARLRHRVRLLTGDDPHAQAAAAARQPRPGDIAGVHAYFAHQPASVASALAGILGVPFGFSVHARDARKIPRSELHRRALRASCVIACNADVAREFDDSGTDVHVVPHGVDLARFSPRPASVEPTLRLLAVGRLVEKKGFHVLLDAVASLSSPWRLRIVGDGPLRDRLAARCGALGIADRVAFCGSMTHQGLPDEYRQADVAVVPSLVDGTGDRDGLPNVLLEAMASGLAVVATDAGAIASAVVSGRNGLLVAQADRPALAGALRLLASDPGLRRSLGDAARSTIEQRYDLRACTTNLGDTLEAAYV